MKTSPLRFAAGSLVFPSALTLLGLLAAAAPGAQAAELPRYELSVGRQMVYRTTDPPSERTDDDGHTRLALSTTTWTITVVDRNADGSYRQVVEELYVHLPNVKDEKTRTESVDGAQFDMMPDGEVLERNPYVLMHLPLQLFPRLAPDAAGLERGWSDELGFDDTSRHYKSAAPYEAAGTVWSFDERVSDNFCLVLDRTNRRHFEFDVARGLVGKITTTVDYAAISGRGAVSATTGIELCGVRQLDTSVLDPYRRESAQFFAAAAKSGREIELADTDLVRASEHYDRGLSTLRELEGRFTVPAIRAMFDAKLSDVVQMRENTIRGSEKLVQLLGTPSPEWTTTDLEGKPVSLADFRGQVVLLDFWYRNCGWCIRAIPEIKKLVEDFRDQGVIVLGMNHDRTIENAQLVVDRLKLNYRSLKDGEDDEAISKKYHVSGWPTLVLLDGHGVIRHIHLGYVPTMREQLASKIREVLNERRSGD